MPSASPPPSPRFCLSLPPRWVVLPWSPRLPQGFTFSPSHIVQSLPEGLMPNDQTRKSPCPRKGPRTASSGPNSCDEVQKSGIYGHPQVLGPRGGGKALSNWRWPSSSREFCLIMSVVTRRRSQLPALPMRQGLPVLFGTVELWQ